VASNRFNRISPIGKSNGSKRFKLSTEPATDLRMEVYTSDSSDSDSREQKTLDYGRLGLTAECLDENLTHLHKINKISEIETIFLNHNGLAELPVTPLCKFMNLRILDLSSNGLTKLPQELLMNCNLSTLIVKNNLLDDDSLPKLLQSKNGNLRELNLSGNQFTQFPENVLNLTSLKYLYLSGNKITSIPKDIWKLQSLHVLSVGGNLLTEVPESVGNLSQLQALILCDNLIEKLPATIARLINLKSMLLHKNRLRHLPRDIITLKNLVELSLRENPLVVRFVEEISLNPPTLRELSARVVRTAEVKYGPDDLPKTILDYLNMAHCCVNPKCKGVFFDNRVEHIKFVDFCGKYRIPLLQYLCSSKCIEPANRPSEPQASASGFMMRKVLLG